MAFYQWQDKNLVLKLHVQTRAKENSIIGRHGDMLKLKIKSPPVDNKAVNSSTSLKILFLI